MTYLVLLPLELRGEILFYINNPWVTVELIKKPIFEELQSNIYFLREFTRKYIDSNNSSYLYYEKISKLYIKHIHEEQSTINDCLKFLKNIYITTDNIFNENLMQCSQYNWYVYLQYTDPKDKRFNHIDFEQIVIEAAYANSMEFFVEFIKVAGHHLSHEVYNNMLMSAYIVTMLKGNLIMFDFLVNLIDQIVYLNDIFPFLTNKTIKKFNSSSKFFLLNDRNLRENLKMSLMSIILLMNNADLNQLMQPLVNEYGANHVKSFVSSIITKNHIDWVIGKHGISCKHNISILLSLNLDKSYLSEENLLRYTI